MEIKSTDEQILSLLREAKSLALICDRSGGEDEVCAMMSFYHLFKSTGAKFRLVVPAAVPESCRDLPESSIIKSDLGPKNLIISLDTGGAALEKISYFQENNVFNLVIHPKERSFEVEKIRYAYEGDRFDLFVLFSVPSLPALGELFTLNETEFAKTAVLNIDFDKNNTRYGSLNWVDETSLSLCESLFKKVFVWNLVPGKAAALSLLKGLSRRAADFSRPDWGSQESLADRVLGGETDLAKSNEALIQ